MKNKNWTIIILIIVILVFGGIFALKMFTHKTIEEGMDYATDKAAKANEEFKIKSEKADIEFAIAMAMFGNDTIESLTYNSLNEELKAKFGVGNYKLTGPNSSGNFTLKVNTRIYTIDSNGKISE